MASMDNLNGSHGRSINHSPPVYIKTCFCNSFPVHVTFVLFAFLNPFAILIFIHASTDLHSPLTSFLLLLLPLLLLLLFPPLSLPHHHPHPAPPPPPPSYSTSYYSCSFSLLFLLLLLTSPSPPPPYPPSSF